MKNIADRPLSLAKHIKELLSKPWPDYNWCVPESCNCGKLAQQILAKNPFGVLVALQPLFAHKNSAPWRDTAKNGFCSITGIPLAGIMSVLHTAGLEQEDFSHIEETDNERIRAAANFTPEQNYSIDGTYISRSDETVVRRYLSTWATMIEEFHASKNIPDKLDIPAMPAVVNQETCCAY